MRKLFSALSSTLQGGVRGGLLFLALVATTSLWAEDFSVNGIYYNYLDGNNVEVTYRGSDYGSYSNEYSGAATIPETVTYNGTTYSVTSIGEDAFYYCTSLSSVTIGNSVTSIGISAFRKCSSLSSFTIGNSVTSIGISAFSGCSSLTSVTIPESVTSIGDGAFYGCSSLTSLTIPNSVTNIGWEVFSSCSSLTSVTIPNSVTSIGISAFRNCSSLTSVTIPNSVTSIGDYAFEGCARLGKISLGTDLEEIAAYAFAGCTRLYDIYVYATYPPFAKESSFANYNAYLYIPCDSKRDYTLDPVWGKFQNIECLSDEPTDMENIETPSQRPTNVQKLLRNSQLIIVREGVEYNAMGQEM